jgi:hypothetical protein
LPLCVGHPPTAGSSDQAAHRRSSYCNAQSSIVEGFLRRLLHVVGAGQCSFAFRAHLRMPAGASCWYAVTIGDHCATWRFDAP